MTTELLTVTKAAEKYRLHPQTVRAWIRKGLLPHIRVGPTRLIRIRDSDLAETVTDDDVEY